MQQPMNMPKKNCILCRRSEVVSLHQIRSYEILKCQHCNLVFTNLEISAEQREDFLQNVYGDQYFSGTPTTWPGKFGYEKNYFLEKGPENERNARRRLDLIEALVPQPGRLLDIGCAGGFFLNAARARGWKTVGQECSVSAVEFATAQFGLEIYPGSFENVRLPENSFDVITAWDVIEHIFEPHAFIQKCANLLKINGLLVLGTPNIDSLAYRFRQEKWVIFKLPEHLFYYNPRTLQRLLGSAFPEVDVRLSYPPYSQIEPTLRAYIKRFLYHGLNLVSHLLRQDEYLLAFARKRN